MNERISKILFVLDSEFPYSEQCFLRFSESWQLAVAAILSAQCTDERVNKITKVLFREFPSANALACAPAEKVENIIKSAGLYKAKTRYITQTARALDELGEVPSDIKSLLKLPGVGRKVANVLRSHLYNIPCVVVDTHVARISRRLELSAETDPSKIERDLTKILPLERQIAFNYQAIMFGRSYCRARSPLFQECPMRESNLCPSAKETHCC